MTIWAGSTMAVMCSVSRHPDWWASFASRWWGRVIIRVSLLPVTVEGTENIEPDTSYVFVSNHQGSYDIFLVCGFLNAKIRWVMKRSLEKIPFLGIGCKRAGYIFVDKANAGQVRRTYRNAEGALKNGASIMIFPEGARTWTGKMKPFRKTAFMLADEFQLPVVPMTINGSFHVLPRKNDGKFICWHPLRLTVHKPIYPQSKGAENVERLMKESYDVISGALCDA